MVIVYFLDTQIWYAIFSTIVGGTYGAFQRLGEVSDKLLLEPRFLEECCIRLKELLFEFTPNLKIYKIRSVDHLRGNLFYAYL